MGVLTFTDGFAGMRCAAACCVIRKKGLQWMNCVSLGSSSEKCGCEQLVRHWKLAYVASLAASTCLFLNGGHGETCSVSCSVVAAAPGMGVQLFECDSGD